MKLKETCLIFVWAHDRESVLVIEKKRGMGKGKWNFPGGKRNPLESQKQMVLRELSEETGLIYQGEIEFCGQIEFHFEKGLSENWSNRCRLFSIDLKARSLPALTAADPNECDPFWMKYESIPWEKFWPDDKNWVPQIRQRQKVFRKCTFNGAGELKSVIELAPSAIDLSLD